MSWSMHQSHAAAPDGLSCLRCGIVSREFAATTPCPYQSPSAPPTALVEPREPEQYESRSTDGDVREKGTVVDRETSAPARPTLGTSEGTGLEGRAGKPRAAEPPLPATSSASPKVEALGPVAGSEPADSHSPLAVVELAPLEKLIATWRQEVREIRSRLPIAASARAFVLEEAANCTEMCANELEALLLD